MPSTFDIPVLSSSPPASEFDVPPRSGQRHYAPMSTPEPRVGLPSSKTSALSPPTGEEKGGKGALNREGRKAAIPENAKNRTTSAPTGVGEKSKDAVPSEDVEVQAQVQVQVQVQAQKNLRGRKAKTSKEDSTSTTSNTTRKRKPQAPTTSSHFTTAPAVPLKGTEQTALKVKVTKPRKPRAKDGAAERVTKPRAKRKSEQPLELDEAISRRRDWTPPRAMEQEPVQCTDSVGKENNLSGNIVNKGSFTSLISGYAYAQAHVASTTTLAVPRAPSTEATSMTKRRRVELVDVPRPTAPEKAKVPKKKKKARTITDLVTDQYAPKDPEPERPVTNDFFPPCATTTKAPLNDTTNTNAAILKKPTLTRSTSKSSSHSNSRTKSKNTKAAGRPKLIAEKLLSPASAVLRMNRQDILFGTSSQLALEDSPTIVRQIQQAIAESEREAGLCLWPGSGEAAGKRSLWKESARNQEGKLLEPQDEDTCMPEPDRTQDFLLLMENDVEEAPDPDPDSSFVDIDNISPVPPLAISTLPCATPLLPAPSVIQLSSDLPTPPRMVEERAVITGKECDGVDHSFMDIEDFMGDLPPSHQHSESSFRDIDDFPTSAQPPAHLPPRSLPSTPTTRRRFIGIEEILDSEDDEALSPTPPRARRLRDSPPLRLTHTTTITSCSGTLLEPKAVKGGTAKATKGSNKEKGKEEVIVYKIPEPHLQFVNIKADLFAKITATIRSLPPTTNPQRPSWHEKILMYDAIVLEDFTAFLCVNPRLRTWKRATQKQIKDWNRHLKLVGEDKLEIDAEGTAKAGGDRISGKDNRGEGMVLAVEKEPEVWMVQKWCEEMSVCCILRDKKGGGARKGLY